MKRSLKKFFPFFYVMIFFQLFFQLGCSSHSVKNSKHVSLSNQSIKKVQFTTNASHRPEFYYHFNDYLHFLKQHKTYEKSAVSRRPSSIKDKSFIDRSGYRESEKLINVYFKTLWQQKKDLEHLLGLNKKEEQICPSFHHELIVSKEIKKLSSSTSNHSSNRHSKFLALNDMVERINENHNPLIYPVLSLGHRSSNDDLLTYSKNSNLSKSDLINSLTEFYRLTEKEVNHLCETGVSAGYFIVRNLADYHLKDGNFLRSPLYLESLLKTSVMANLYVLKSFKKNNSLRAEEANLLSKLKARDFYGYIDFLATKSNNHLARKK